MNFFEKCVYNGRTWLNTKLNVDCYKATAYWIQENCLRQKNQRRQKKRTITHRQISWQRALLNNSRSIAITNEHCFTWSYMSVL
jgi:hypothetical protein